MPEVRAMLQRRCDLAGVPIPFSEEAIERIYTYSRGVPRDALRIADTTYGIMLALEYSRAEHGMAAAIERSEVAHV